MINSLKTTPSPSTTFTFYVYMAHKRTQKKDESDKVVWVPFFRHRRFKILAAVFSHSGRQPAQMLAQSRDAHRLTELKGLNSAPLSG